MRARTITKILAGLLTLIILAMLVAPMFISSDTLKAQLVAQVKKATGRTLDIKGATSVKFFPNIAVTAEDVTLSNPEGYSTPYFVHLDKLSTGAALKPLLNGELIVTGITLDGLNLNLEERADGKKNWDFTAEKVQDAAEKSTESPAAQPESNSPIKRFALGDVTINEGTLSFVKPKANVMAFNHINATIQGADATAPLNLDVTAEYRGEEISLAIDLAKSREFLNGEASGLLASVKLPGASLDYNGTASMNESIIAAGKFALSSASLPKVMAWATGTTPSTSMPTQVSVKGDMKFAQKVLTLNDAVLRADDLQADGKLTVDISGKKPAIRGALNLGDLDMDALTKSPASSSTGSGNSVAAQSDGWSSKPVDLSGLHAVDADLALTMKSIALGKLKLGATAVDVALNAGKLAATIKQAQLYDGNATGVVRASSSGVGADMDITNVKIEPLLVAMTGKSRLAGTGNVKLNLNASGNTMRAWMGSLNGNGRITLRDGALKGINIGQFLRNAKQGFLFKSESEATDFSEMAASFTVAQGILTNNDLAMKSPALRVAGSGTANLPNKTINYRLVPTLAGTSKGQGGKDDVAGLSIPMVITGPWANPSVTPDLAGMIQEGLNNPEALKANAKALKETVKDFNSADDLKRALLGGKKPATTTTTPAATDAPVPTEKERRAKAIEEGLGGLLKGL